MTINLPIFRSRFTDIANNRENIENIFAEFFNDFNRHSSSLLSETVRASLLPRLNISETDNKYFIEAELPGVKQSDLELKLDNNILVIKGKTEESKESKERNGKKQSFPDCNLLFNCCNNLLTFMIYATRSRKQYHFVHCL